MSEEKPRFTILGDKHFVDNIIYNTLSGEQYQVEWLLLDGRANKDDAVAKAKACELHGGGWALSDNPPDYLSLAVYDDPGTAVHPELRSLLPRDWYWTGRDDPSVSSFAFLVNLYYGGVSCNGRGYGGLVLACRRVSPRQ